MSGTRYISNTKPLVFIGLILFTLMSCKHSHVIQNPCASSYQHVKQEMLSDSKVSTEVVEFIYKHKECFYGLNTDEIQELFGPPTQISDHNEWRYHLQGYPCIESCIYTSFLFDKNGILESVEQFVESDSSH